MVRVDRDGERFVFENGWDLLIPYSAEQYTGGELEVSVIPKLAPTVRRFLKKFHADPFSDAALTALWDAVRPFEAVWGYTGGKYRWRRCRIFRVAGGDYPESPAGNCRILTAADEEKNRTTYSLPETEEAGMLAVGYLENGEVVSVAVTHTAPDETEPGGTVEIGVETIPAARGRGYALDCLRAVTGILLSRGLVPEYRSVRSNRASARVAQKAGYLPAGEACYLLMRRNPKKTK